MEEQLAELDRQRDELVKKIAQKNAWATEGSVEKLREELTKLIHDRTPAPAAQTTYTDKGLAMTDLSVYGPEKFAERPRPEPETKPSRPDRASLRKWDEFAK